MPARVIMYGIRNCDTVKRARAWLDDHQVSYTFHDFKASGIERARLEGWCQVHGWETMLNRAGTTFRKLAESDKQDLSEQKAIALMLEHPTMIKRPVLEDGGRSMVGFSADRYTEFVG